MTPASAMSHAKNLVSMRNPFPGNSSNAGGGG
jgi:hypothetical protein